MDDWQYLADTDEDGLPNLIEKEIGSDPYNPDTDGDGLPDGYEALTLGTDPTKPDTDDNGVLDCDEDFDEDGLSNGQEYELGTEPYNEDTDGDGLKYGEEINTYGTDPLKVDTDEDGLEDGDEIYFETDPLNPDSDGNGISDGDEKRSQTFIHEVENEDCAVTEVRVTMEGTGNLQKTTSVESIMNKDILCSDVVGLVGEPFSIETTSQFDKATLTYVIDKSKLGDTDFDNLLFLWYDEENDNFVELDTVLDEKNSTVSVETTHFSKYMLVDQVEWFKAWKNASLYFEDTYEPLATVICYDCSGSMSSNDRTFNYNIFNDDGTIAYSYPTCYRKLAIDSFIDSMMLTDKTALVSFESSAKLVSGFSSDNDVLKSLVKPYNGGGTNARAALDIAINQLETVEHWYSRHVILLSDGDVNVTANQILQAKTAGIKIHTIGLGSGANNQKLQNCARDTGGQFFAAKTAEELDAIYRDLSKDNHFDLEGLPDEDDDGLPDEFEVSGLVISNAQVIYTDPENPDCDDDDLLDGQEISIDGAKSKTVKIGSADGGYITYSTVVFKYSSDPNNGDTDGDGILDVNDSKPCNPYLCTGIWTASDEKFSTTVQAELLKLELAWHLAVTDTDRIDIANRADEIRDIMSSGKGRILDIAKSISGAASDEFAWFLGGDVSAAERDYWLSEVNKYNPSISISDEKVFHSIMFIAGILEPSPDDAWKLISKKAKKEMLEKCDEGVVKKFLKSMGKQATKEGTMGIKKLSGKGIKGFMYEVKVMGKGGAYRLLGNKTENGEIFWEVFEKTHK